MAITNWMSWEGGVDLVAATQPGLSMPNVIVHVARMVQTPVGSAPAGMVLLQLDPNAAPLVMGFVSPDGKLGQYFGPKIFAGTPFEGAPVLTGTIETFTSVAGEASSKVTIGATVIEVRLTGLKALTAFNRTPGPMSPFTQQGLEAEASKASLIVNGKEISIIVPPVGIAGGAAAVWSPTGSYAR